MCWYCLHKISKLVRDYRNYSLPNLARFETHDSYLKKIQTTLQNTESKTLIGRVKCRHLRLKGGTWGDKCYRRTLLCVTIAFNQRRSNSSCYPVFGGMFFWGPSQAGGVLAFQIMGTMIPSPIPLVLKRPNSASSPAARFYASATAPTPIIQEAYTKDPILFGAICAHYLWPKGTIQHDNSSRDEACFRVDHHLPLKGGSMSQMSETLRTPGGVTSINQSLHGAE